MSSKTTLNTLLAGAVAMAAMGTVAASSTAHAAKDGKEKCYGVVKAGKNTCGAADKSHSCAGQATTDASGEEWLYLPTGVCEKLANGSVEPFKAVEAEDTEDHSDHADTHAE
tara:strand:- start:9485 stop:9820 length:336 start_codon:yes stop_codon:yes gene_type:complete